MNPMSKSPLSYEDIREALDRALEAKKGVRLKLDSNDSAKNFQHRANFFRRQDREDNTKIFPIGHEYNPAGKRGLSVYDKLKISVRDNIVEIRKYSASVLHTEELE